MEHQLWEALGVMDQESQGPLRETLTENHFEQVDDHRAILMTA